MEGALYAFRELTAGNAFIRRDPGVGIFAASSGRYAAEKAAEGL